MGIAAKVVKAARAVATGRVDAGFCHACGRRTLFAERGPNLRDDYLCVLCRSNPRQRAMMRALEAAYPAWRDMTVYEPSGHGPASERLERSVASYTKSHYYADRAPGDVVDGVVVQDLRRLTLDDASVDIVVTQDVLEHLFDWQTCVQEIHRVLRPGGAHVFTTPLVAGDQTRVRARFTHGGEVEHLLPPEYHGDPVSEGVLVVTDWGRDVARLIDEVTGGTTEIVDYRSRRLGLDGPLLEVGITQKL